MRSLSLGSHLLNFAERNAASRASFTHRAMMSGSS
jgi:hypothetical protein